MREPSFWWRRAGAAAWLLQPLAFIYGKIAAYRMTRSGTRASVPVLCVGNFTLGGTGKTPAALAFAKILVEAGESPVFLTRGYGGTLKGPLLVKPDSHRADETGDEPLLLARFAPTVVARNRVAGAALAQQHGASVIVMDDGLQNPSLHKNICIAVIDARRGLGNEFVFPAGPLRAPLAMQKKKVDAVLVVGNGSRKQLDLSTPMQRFGLPVLHARLISDDAAVKSVGKRKVLAFAGIGDPEKFFMSLAAAGIEATIERSYPDHHPYSESDALDILAECNEKGLLPVTTEKDRVRISGRTAALKELAAKARSVPVSLVFDDEKAVRQFLADGLKPKRARTSKSGG